jgi:hypothetical protein
MLVGGLRKRPVIRQKIRFEAQKINKFVAERNDFAVKDKHGEKQKGETQPKIY